MGAISQPKTLVVVVDRHRQGPLGHLLADYVGVEVLVYVGGIGYFLYPVALGGGLIIDDLVAEIDALVAYVDTWTCDQLQDLFLGLSAETALEEVCSFPDHRTDLSRFRLQ